jgi:type IV pilus assembly protein PilQ
MNARTLFALALGLATSQLEAADAAKVSLDLKDADASDIVSVLARAADRQPVFNPGISCRVTLKVKAVPWRAALDVVLRACSLGVEESGTVLRVAPLASLTAEQAQTRALDEAKAKREPEGRLETARLSYARVAELAPLLQKLLPRGKVSWDERTNTLILTY